MEKTVKKKTKGLALRPTEWESLKQLAVKEGRSVNNYIENILITHIRTQSE